MRLIDADALENAILNMDEYVELSDVIKRIDNAPTVEITEEQAIDKLHESGWLPLHDKEMTERPTGEWIKNTDDNLLWAECSLCHYNEECYGYAIKYFHYCPNCGARMEDKEE